MPHRIAIVGTGPIGLEAALYARTLGHQVVVYEKGDLADNVRKWRFVTLFSPWEMNTSELGWQAINLPEQRPHPQVCPSGDEFRERYLFPLAESPLLRETIRTQTTVVSIGRDGFNKADEIGRPTRAESPFRLLLRNHLGHEWIERADVVLDCSGTYGHHRWAGRGGMPAPGEMKLQDRIWYTIPDVLDEHRERFVDRHTLLIGCGYSAATVLRNLERLNRAHLHTRVTWVIRRPGQALEELEHDPLPARTNLVKAALQLAERPPEWLQFLGDSSLESIAPGPPFSVTLQHGKIDLAMTADQIVALVGYSPDSSIYDQLQVHQCYATAGPMKMAAGLLGSAGGDCLSTGTDLGPDALKNPEPRFFILGAKSFGTNSRFLIRTGLTQVRDVFRLIDGPQTPDLYQQTAKAQ